MQYNFEWNPSEAKMNIKKHKVNFENAATALKTQTQFQYLMMNIAMQRKDGLQWDYRQMDHGPLLVVHHTYNEINDVNIRFFF